MAERLTVTIMDADKDTQDVSFDGIVMTAGNYNAEIAKMDAILTALDPFILGVVKQSSRIANFAAGTLTPPANHAAQKHTRWLFTFKDLTTAATWTRKVSTADYTKATSQDFEGNFYVDLSDGADGAALKAAFDAFITHPETGNAGVLIDVRIWED